MNTRNIIAVILGAIIGIIPVFTSLVFNYIGRSLSLIIVSLFCCLIGVLIYSISQPKHYYLVPAAGFLSVSAYTIYQLIIFGDFDIMLESLLTFIFYVVFGEMGYWIAKFIHRFSTTENP